MKRKTLILASIIFIGVQLACSIGQSSPTTTPNLIGLTPIHNYGTKEAEETFIFVTQGPYDGHQPLATQEPPQYVRPETKVGNTPCVLTGEFDCVIFFTDTGEPWGALLSRATREMILGTDLPSNTVLMLIFDENETPEPRNELVQINVASTEDVQVKVDNGGLLVSVSGWAEYVPTTGIAFEDTIFAMREASLDLLADSIIDNSALSDAGQLCLESGKEISKLFPCHRPNATMIPTP